MRCERAVIVVGGVGSRGLEWTYANEKCQLPLPATVINPDGTRKRATRSVVSFVVDDCLRAGINDFTFIVGEGAVNTRRAYEGNPPVDEYFESQGKAHLLNTIKGIGNRATFRFIEQRFGGDEPYGTTVPVALARESIEQSGSTLIVMGDQLFHRPDGSSEAANLIDATASLGASAGMLVKPVDPNAINHYGIAHLRGDGLLDAIIEKPPVGSIPECDANASMYVVDRHIMPYVDKNMAAAGGGERMFTDVINDFAPSRPVAVVTAGGEYLDCGSPETYEASFLYMREQALALMQAGQ